MAEIRPFRGLRFSDEAGKLGDLTAPPYDVLNEEQRDSLAARNPHNIVHLTLPTQKEDDRSKFVKYARSAALLAEWRQTGALVPEPEPAFYRYTQTFANPFGEGDLTRTSVIALLKTEPYEKGVVLPHEQTFPKHKEDRLRILEATRAHLECIFGLFEDPGATIYHALVAAPAGAAAKVVSDDGTSQTLEPITDPAAIAQLQKLLADKKIWIADGHHRYETALNFRAAHAPGGDRIAEDYLMIALASMSDPGLILMPTHRVLKSATYSADALIERLEGVFQVEETHSSRVFPTLRMIEEQGGRAIGVAIRGGRGYILRAHEEDKLSDLLGSEGSEALRGLDVTILHRAIFERILEIHGLDSIAYTRDAHEAVRWVEEGAEAAFLMNPPTVEDMRTIALGGEKMPQKSTYYFPKILSGLVLWSLNDF